MLLLNEGLFVTKAGLTQVQARNLTVPLLFFQLIIFCDAHQFKVAVNGVHILEYKHRFKQLEKINLLEVTGDVQLLDVRSW